MINTKEKINSAKDEIIDNFIKKYIYDYEKQDYYGNIKRKDYEDGSVY